MSSYCLKKKKRNGWKMEKVGLVFTLRKNYSLYALFIPHRLTHPHIHK